MSPNSIGRVAAMLRLSVACVTCRYSQYVIIMITHDKMVEKKNGDRAEIWFGVLVGVRGCVLQPTGHSLVTLFPCLCRLRTGRWIRF